MSEYVAICAFIYAMRIMILHMEFAHSVSACSCVAAAVAIIEYTDL